MKRKLLWVLVLIIIAAVGFAWWLLNRSTLGFELRTVGANQTAARTAGMSVGRTQIMAMLLAGGLMGLVGVSQVLGTANANNALTQQIDADHYRQVARIPTGPVARTSLFVPEWRQLFVAVPRDKDRGAELRVFEAVP